MFSFHSKVSQLMALDTVSHTNVHHKASMKLVENTKTHNLLN